MRPACRPRSLAAAIDPEVINVGWSVDGQVVAADGGTSFDVAAHALSAGSHTVTAKAYDNAGPELARYVTGTKGARARRHWQQA